MADSEVEKEDETRRREFFISEFLLLFMLCLFRYEWKKGLIADNTEKFNQPCVELTSVEPDL